MGLKQLPADFKEFIQFLNDHSVHYLLLGGWAVGLYGNPRATKDIDFLIATDDNNIRKLQQALLARIHHKFLAAIPYLAAQTSLYS